MVFITAKEEDKHCYNDEFDGFLGITVGSACSTELSPSVSYGLKMWS